MRERKPPMPRGTLLCRLDALQTCIPLGVLCSALLLILACTSNGYSGSPNLDEVPRDDARLVYIYELPLRFNEELVKNESWGGASFDSYGYDTEAIIHRLLLESNAIRTSDPTIAQFFFVPIYAAHFLEKQRHANGGVVLEKIGKFVEDALRYIQKNYPYWKQSNGRNHFIVSSHDYGRCSSLALCDPNIIGEMFTLQLYGEPALNKLGTKLQNKIEELQKNTGVNTAPVCYSRSTDVIIPSMSTEPVVSPMEMERTKDLFRSKEWNSNGETDKDGLLSIRSSVLESEMYTAKFCIGPVAPARRTAALTRAIVAGCIPVLNFSDTYEWPWQSTLDYRAFTLSVNMDADGNGVSQQVAAIVNDPAKLQEMQRSLASVQHLFTYSRATPGSRSAFRKLVGDLKVRARNVEQFPTAQVPKEVPCSPSSGAGQDGLQALRRSLADPAAKVRLCTPKLTPMVMGTYHLGTEQAQLIVFEAEILYGFVPGTSKRRDTMEPIIQLLAFLEDHRSIIKSQWHGWGGAYLSDIAEKRRLKLRCEFWPGHDREDMRRKTPLFVTDALVADYTLQYTLQLHCPLPSPESLPPELLTAPIFQIRLTVRDPMDSVLHMATLPICRTDQHASLKGGEMASGAEMVRTANDIVPLKMGICLYPYRDHRPFEFKYRGNSTVKLMEWIDFHLLLGISHIYFYDRYWDEKLPLLQSYVDRGVLVHVPFPMWSEVFYRKGVYNDSSSLYAFPQSYDQIIAYEHCTMQGRRHDFEWLFFTDVDEFLSIQDGAPGGLSYVMQSLEEKHSGGLPLAVVRIQRFNFVGATDAPVPVLKDHTQRCLYPMKHRRSTWGGVQIVDSHDKLATRPYLMVGSKNEIHMTQQTPEGAIMVGETSAINIHHYASTPLAEYEKLKMNFTPCKKKDDIHAVDTTLVDDSSLVWAAKTMDDCKTNCDMLGRNYQECGTMCGNWPKLA